MDNERKDDGLDVAWRGMAGKARLGLARRGLARLGLGSAWQGLARRGKAGEAWQAWQARLGEAGPGSARHGRQCMELKEVAMDNERKDDGLDVAWREFDAAVERLRRAVNDLENVLGRKELHEGVIPRG